MTTFHDLALAEPIQKALDAANYETPTPIQVQAIPPVMNGADLLGIAQTGTGKTAAFALPILHRLLTDPKRPYRKGCRALILSPTRELAAQIADAVRSYGRNIDLTTATLFGGVNHKPQIRSVARGVDVMIATPGRLLDLVSDGHCDLSATEILVLDEADQMLDLGFLPPIRAIAARIPLRRQTLFFSATMPPDIAKLADTFLNDPVSVKVAPQSTTVERIAQRVIHIEPRERINTLAEVLSAETVKRALVFTRTKRGADRVARQLSALDFAVEAIHGNK
ncbi:MAG: DEAD/DEAH box helicase, partial [Pseudomonadota bacterium]